MLCLGKRKQIFYLCWLRHFFIDRILWNGSMDHVVKRIDKCCDLSAIFTDLLNATFVPRSNRFILLMVKKKPLWTLVFHNNLLNHVIFFSIRHWIIHFLISQGYVITCDNSLTRKRKYIIFWKHWFGQIFVKNVV